MWKEAYKEGIENPATQEQKEGLRECQAQASAYVQGEDRGALVGGDEAFICAVSLQRPMLEFVGQWCSNIVRTFCDAPPSTYRTRSWLRRR